MHCRRVTKALYDYDAQGDEELSIREGDILLVTDDADQEWWTAVQKPTDTFGDARQGLVPATYVEEAEPLAILTSLYPYEAAATEELGFPEGAAIRIYDMGDPDWWFAQYQDAVGLVPATYLQTEGDLSETAHQAHVEPPQNTGVVEAPNAVPVSMALTEPPVVNVEQAQNQKQQLLSALGGFGFDKPKSIPKEVPEQLGPENISYYGVTEVDKKKKKKGRKGFMGFSDEFLIYFISDLKSKDILQKWNLSEVSKFSEKKGKKLILEFGAEERQFEGEKADILAMIARLDQLQSKRKLSGTRMAVPQPIATNTPPTPAPPSPIAISKPPASVPALPDRTQSATPKMEPPDASNDGPKIAVALYDYEATTDDELTIHENDNLLVLDNSDDQWWRVRLISKKGREGLVPASYVELKQRLPSNGDGERANGGTAAHQEEERTRWEREEEERRRREGEERRRREEEETSRKEEEERRRRREEEQRRQREEERQRRKKLEEEEARKARETQVPVLPQRPLNVHEPPHRPTPAIPASMPPRPPRLADAVSTNTRPTLPNRPPVPAARPRPDEQASKKAAVKEGSDRPDLKKIRTWTDRTGSFQVEAEFLAVSDGKVHLHKANGVKIAVPLAKLDPKDIEFIKSLPGNANIEVPLPAARPGQGPSVATLAAAASIPPPTTKANFVYNKFDWHDFLLKAGVSAGDAVLYAQKFVGERMDKSHLGDLDRDLLRGLGVTEGDILRIRKAASLPNSSPAVIAATNEREQAALQNNLQMLGKVSALGDVSRQNMPRRQSRAASAAGAPNMQVIQQAADLLKASSGSHRQGSPNTSPPGTPSGRASTRSSVSVGSSVAQHPTKSSIHDPWAVSASSKLASSATPTASSASTSQHSSQAQQQSLLATQKQQQEAQQALEQAQQALLKAQEQARQAQQVQAQAALLKAQETARQAALIQQQTQQALLSARQAALARPITPALATPPLNTPALSLAPRPAALPPPLIPTPSSMSGPGFVPVGGARPSAPNMGSIPAQFHAPGNSLANASAFGQGSGDKYSAFKALDPLTPSVFSQPAGQSFISSSQPIGIPGNASAQPSPQINRTNLPSPALSLTGSTMSSASSAFSQGTASLGSSGASTPNGLYNMPGTPGMNFGGAGSFLQGVARGPMPSSVGMGSTQFAASNNFQPQQFTPNTAGFNGTNMNNFQQVRPGVGMGNMGGIGTMGMMGPPAGPSGFMSNGQMGMGMGMMPNGMPNMMNGANSMPMNGMAGMPGMGGMNNTGFR